MDDKTTMDGKSTLVATAIPNPSEMASVQEYFKKVQPLLEAAGGKLAKRLKVDKVVHGKPSEMVLVMEFDSSKAITALFESEDYAALIPIRDRGFSEINILITQEL